jgi:hypothetical protein
MPQFAERLVNMMRDIMSRPLDESGEAIQLYEEASEALNELILPWRQEPKNSVLFLLELFGQILEELNASRQSNDSDNIRFVVQARLCGNLTVLAVRLRMEISDVYLHRCLDVLFNLLGRPNVTVYEEAIVTLAGLYIHLYPRFNREHINTMLQIAHTALDSRSPGVINSASVLIGQLFLKGNAEVADKFLEIFNILEGLLREHPEMRDMHALVVKAIAQMFEGVGNSPEQREITDGLEPRLFELMRMVRAAPIDVTKEADIIYANQLFESVCQLYCVYAVLYYPHRNGQATPEILAQEKLVLTEMANLATVLLKVRTLKPYVLTEFMKMARAFANDCSRKNNVTLNRSAVHKVIELAAAPHQMRKMQTEAREASRYLKSK